MNKIIKKLNLKQVNLYKWENDNYILEAKPNALGLQATAVKCLAYFPEKYPKLKKEIKKIGEIKISIKLKNNYTLIKTDVKKYREYVELIHNTDIK